MGIRHQLPAYSPITARASLLAAAQTLHLGDDPRPRLRALLEREYDARSVLLCGSGTQALTIAIDEARKSADPAAPVALPAFSCFDVATAAIGADARIMLYDLDPDTLAPDLESLERTMRAGAGIIVIAPLFGLPVDWSELSTLAERYGAVLVEDAAQGSGATWRGCRVGTLGEISTLSFGRGKGWTGGSGGAVLLRRHSKESTTSIRTSHIGQEATDSLRLGVQWMLGRPTLYRIPVSIPGLGLGETTYRAPGNVTSISRSAAVALLATYEASNREAEARRANSSTMLSRIAGSPRVRTLPIAAESVAGYLRLPVRVTGGSSGLESWRNARALGVAESYPSTLADLAQVARRLCGPDHKWQGSELLVRELVTLPTHSRVTPEEISRVADLLRV
jgi:dTDP-4-amino-4,6-dideoxygalactose transaminase